MEFFELFGDARLDVEFEGFGARGIGLSLTSAMIPEIRENEIVHLGYFAENLPGLGRSGREFRCDCQYLFCICKSHWKELPGPGLSARRSRWFGIAGAHFEGVWTIQWLRFDRPSRASTSLRFAMLGLKFGLGNFT